MMKCGGSTMIIISALTILTAIIAIQLIPSEAKNPSEIRKIDIILPVGHVWIGEYPKILILKALWKAANIAGFYRYNPVNPPVWDDNIAYDALDDGYIDYLLGRCIKIEITRSSISIDTRLYDRDSTVPAAQTIATLMIDS
jgi:hypothetical protein